MFWAHVFALGLISSLLLATVHLALRYWLHMPLHVVWRYVIGVLAMYVPLTLYFWGAWELIGALWIVAGMTGFSVGGLYLLGDWVDKNHKVKEGGEREKTLEAHVYGRKDDARR